MAAAVAAAAAARAAQAPELLAEAALVPQAAPDPAINTIAKQLCEEALAGLGAAAHEVLRARLLAQRSHLAVYGGEQGRVETLSAAALDLARPSGDDRRADRGVARPGRRPARDRPVGSSGCNWRPRCARSPAA